MSAINQYNTSAYYNMLETHSWVRNKVWYQDLTYLLPSNTLFIVMSPLQLLYTKTRAKPCQSHIVHNSPLGGSLFFCSSVFSPSHASLPDASDIASFSLNAQQKGYSNMHSFRKPDWSLNCADTFASLKLASRRNSVHNAAS